MKKILLTGATGFVGKQVLKYLRTKDVDILLTVRNDKDSLFSSFPSENIILTNDIFAESVEWWSNLLEDIDTVIHLAWYAEPEKYLNAPENFDCLIGSLKLAKAVIKSRVRRFVGIGTCFEYDLSKGFLSLDTNLNPLTPYSSSKVALYTCLSNWLPMQSIEFAWCRLFYLYGDGEDGRRLAAYVHNKLQNNEIVKLTSGNQIRDYLNVSVAGEMIVKVALGSQIGAINICSGIPISIRKFVEDIADSYGKRELLRFGALVDRDNDPAIVVGVR